MSTASIDASLEFTGGTCVLTHEPLDANRIIESVKDDSAGAIAVFIGTTRNSFKGKVVTRLEYQAYSKLAIKTMADTIHSAQQSAPPSSHQAPSVSQMPTLPLLRCAVYHRLGTVPVGDPSIVIAVSSPHRKEAFVACESILEDIKFKAQIWKREYYESDGEDEAEWKANH